MSTKILGNFYRCAVESVITSSITVWHGGYTGRFLQRVLKTTQFISGAAFPSLMNIYTTRVIRRPHNIRTIHTHNTVCSHPCHQEETTGVWNLTHPGCQTASTHGPSDSWTPHHPFKAPPPPTCNEPPNPQCNHCTFAQGTAHIVYIYILYYIILRFVF